DGPIEFAGIEADDADAGRQPEIVPVVLRNRIRAAVGQSVRAAHRHKTVAAQPAQSVGAADPDRPFWIFVEVVVRTRAEAGRIVGAEITRPAEAADVRSAVRDPEVVLPVDERRAR